MSGFSACKLGLPCDFKSIGIYGLMRITDILIVEGIYGLMRITDIFIVEDLEFD